MQNNTTAILSPITVFQQFNTEDVHANISAHMLSWMKPFKRYGAHYLPQGNRATVRKKFQNYMRKELSSLRPSNANGLATGNWQLNSGLEVSQVWTLLMQLYQTIGQHEDAAYTVPLLKDYPQQPKRAAYVSSGTAPTPKPKKENIARRGGKRNRKPFWASSQRLNVARRNLNSWAQAERKKSDEALIAFLVKLKNILADGQAITKPNKEQRAYISAVKSSLSKVQSWLSDVKADYNPFNGGERNAYIHWWRTEGFPEIRARERQPFLAAKAAKTKKLKLAQSNFVSNADVISEEEMQTAIAVKRKIFVTVKKFEKPGSAVKREKVIAKWVWMYEVGIATEQSEAKSHQAKSNGLIMDINGKLRRAEEIAAGKVIRFKTKTIKPRPLQSGLSVIEPENPMLEPITVLPKRVQNTPPVKQKGKAVTEATTIGRVYRKMGINPYKQGNAHTQAPKEHKKFVLLSAEERRQKRGADFYQQWCQENADLLQQQAA